MKTLSLLVAATLLFGVDASAQCTDLPNRCGPVQIQCVGQPNIGCSNFGIQAMNYDPRAMGSVALIANCAQRPLPITAPPACGMGGCLLFADVPAIVLPLNPNPLFGLGIMLPVPNDPAVIGTEICVQFGQLSVPPGTNGRPCLSLSNGLAIQVGRGPCR